MSERIERELQALRTDCPAQWRTWARMHGSNNLKRTLLEVYPFAGILRRELLALACPPVEGTERDDAQLLGHRIELGDERAPHEASFAVLDAIHRNATAARNGPRWPIETELTLLRLRRATLYIGNEKVLASAAGVEIACGLVQVTTLFVWGRSDR